jgi:hypothetical protein
LFENRLLQRHVVSFSVIDGIRPGGVRVNWPNEWPNALARPETPWTMEFKKPRAHA